MDSIQDFLHALRIQDWKGSDGPMRLCRKLEAADYAHAPVPANVRILLERLDAAGGVTATTARNLPRSFVGDLFERLHIPDFWKESIRAVNKVINEQDVGDLHLARVLAHSSGFLELRKKRFQPTHKGKQLLAPDHAGEFYRELFVGHFRKFNLSYNLFFGDIPEVQLTLPAILWRMDSELRDWTPVSGLASRILLPRVLQAVRDREKRYLDEVTLLVALLYRPLQNMGLLEADDAGDSRFGIDEKSRIKTTHLWRKFLWFDWQP